MVEELAAGHSMGENIKGKRYTTAKDYLMRVQDLSQVEGIAVVLNISTFVFYEETSLILYVDMNHHYAQPNLKSFTRLPIITL